MNQYKQSLQFTTEYNLKGLDAEYKGDIRGCMNPKRTPDGDDFQGDIYIRLHRDWSLLKVKR